MHNKMVLAVKFFDIYLFSLRIPTPNDGEILFDYSKNRVDDSAFSLLFNLAKSRNVEKARDAMFSGEFISFRFSKLHY